MPAPSDPTDSRSPPGGARLGVPPALVLVFGLSGCAALLFETVWFRQAGLMLGNSVWASSIVLASFMGGLALGNHLAARRGGRVARPVVLYAQLELTIAFTGLALVLLFPVLTPRLAPVLRDLTGSPALLAGARMLVAFLLMVVPATAMGATLPVLVAGLTRDDAHFGRLLGALYGWNTLGAVGGALLGELALIEALGVRGTGCVAAGLDVLAAAVAVGVYRNLSPQEGPPVRYHPRPGRAVAQILATACLAGGTLLMLEVVWFRFLLLWVNGNSLAFALMLAVVLFGIGAGGLAASGWMRLRPGAERWVPAIAALACIATVSGYTGFRSLLGSHRAALYQAGDIAILATGLMLPTALLSGLLFALLGARLKGVIQGNAETAGRLTLANTLGALCGAASGGLLLLPALGIEGCLFAGAATYLLMAALNWPVRGGPSRSRGEAWVLGTLLAVAGLMLGLFPFGLMHRFCEQTATRWVGPGPHTSSRLVAVREGLGETAMYLETSFWNQPTHYRLLTDSTSMSSTVPFVARYMNLFVWLPMALQPQAQDALLISFGVGTTARALTDTASLRRIDVVDTSREILALGRIPFANEGPYPLDDPRVRVHVEDGRFFLLTTDNLYDLITAEPPPPKNAGIVNLYSQEHFALIRAHLRPGGLATYWLPVGQLTPSDAQAVVHAFCAVFADCTLWSGSAYEWILMGSRNGVPAGSEESFSRQWRDPRVQLRLREVGLDTPEHIGLTFLADAKDLLAWSGRTPALDDDHPFRLSPSPVFGLAQEYVSMASAQVARERFASSAFVAAAWPAGLRERTLARFESEWFALSSAWWRPPAGGLPALYAALSGSGSRAIVLFILSSDTRIEKAAERARAAGLQAPYLLEHEAISALADRDYERAEQLFARVPKDSPLAERVLQWRVLALLLQGQHGRAAALLRDPGGWPRVTDGAAWSWLLERFDLPDPHGVRTHGPGA